MLHNQPFKMYCSEQHMPENALNHHFLIHENKGKGHQQNIVLPENFTHLYKILNIDPDLHSLLWSLILSSIPDTNTSPFILFLVFDHYWKERVDWISLSSCWGSFIHQHCFFLWLVNRFLSQKFWRWLTNIKCEQMKIFNKNSVEHWLTSYVSKCEWRVTTDQHRKQKLRVRGPWGIASLGATDDTESPRNLQKSERESLKLFLNWKQFHCVIV